MNIGECENHFMYLYRGVRDGVTIYNSVIEWLDIWIDGNITWRGVWHILDIGECKKYCEFLGVENE